MDHSKLVQSFLRLTRGTKWTLNETIPLKFNNRHAQGLTRIGGLFYLSSVEVTRPPVKYDRPIQGADRSPGQGIGRLFAFDRRGELVNETVLGEGTIYHPGGIDFDGSRIWVPAAEYVPGGRSIVYKVDPATLRAEEAFRFGDHIGGLVCDRDGGRLIGCSWGSRTFYVWDNDGKLLAAKENPSHFVDYQDGQYAGEGCMTWSGISELPLPAPAGGLKHYELGGLALFDTASLSMLHEVPVAGFSPHGRAATRNPVFLESDGSRLRLYAVPDDDCGSLLIYEAAAD
ncbi:DUF6454 family protein [Paenibacillus humicola]|uniref:DUF6454 family protein n=1 Tax=Paenibacillus humicola TaxID=3110540 RepID=UPI00237AD215|nr:DUF6454 family protein [Paenibacillus humicola]